MKESQRTDLIEQMIRADENYNETMDALFEKCLSVMPGDLRRRGKKVICDGEARQKAQDGVKIMELLMECPIEPDDRNK